MVNLPILFVIIYALCIVVFFLIPKQAFISLIQRDIDKDFDVDNLKKVNPYALNYYRLVLLVAAIVAALIPFILKVIFY